MARNIKPNELVHTRLFKEVSPFINSISNAQLLFELCKASTTTEVDVDAFSIDVCMTWDLTPQAHDFWSNLNANHHQNKMLDAERKRLARNVAERAARVGGDW